jgi:glycosyltransferase 2 family protein
MKRILSLVVSLAILALIYWQIDVGRMIDVLQKSHLGWLLASLAMVVPITILTAERLRMLTPLPAGLRLGDAVGLILSASVLNMVLPSKMGDVAKSVFMKQHGLSGSLALALVILEKACDMLSLLLWCTIGLAQLPHHGTLFWILGGCVVLGVSGGIFLLSSPAPVASLGRVLTAVGPARWQARSRNLEENWRQMREFVWNHPPRLAAVTGVSLFLWFLHLAQIWMFTIALRSEVPFVANLGLAPLAILAGLLPLTFAGVGTRDAALILFYRPYLDPATGAALGLLCTSRYLMPALGGVPFLRRHLGEVWGR